MRIRHIARAQWLDGAVRTVEVRGVDSDGGITDETSCVPIDGTVLRPGEPCGPAVPLSSVKLVCPLEPSKVVGIGSNYRAHALEMGRALPTVPKMFLKPSTSVVGPLDAICLPPDSAKVDHEAELGLVIGQRCRDVSAADARSVVAGLTVVNDVTARDFQRSDGVFGRAKGFDTFCPIGPWVTHGLAPDALEVWATVDGDLRQHGVTSDMVFGPDVLVSFVSQVMTLNPGDVIATGTPSGVGPLQAGQRVSVGVRGVGELSNVVVAKSVSGER